VQAPQGGRRPFAASALVGSELLTRALGSAQCGCLLLDKAAREPAGGAKRAGFERAGRQLQRLWRCPRGPDGPGATAPSPTPDTQRAHAMVAALTGCDHGHACPVLGAYEPWVGKVIEARAARDCGELGEFWPAAPAVLWDAMFALDRAQGNRFDREQEEAERKAKADSADAARRAGRPPSR
jgi:hypothetical protein